MCNYFLDTQFMSHLNFHTYMMKLVFWHMFTKPKWSLGPWHWRRSDIYPPPRLPARWGGAAGMRTLQPECRTQLRYFPTAGQHFPRAGLFRGEEEAETIHWFWKLGAQKVSKKWRWAIIFVTSSYISSTYTCSFLISCICEIFEF